MRTLAQETEAKRVRNQMIKKQKQSFEAEKEFVYEGKLYRFSKASGSLSDGCIVSIFTAKHLKSHHPDHYQYVCNTSKITAQQVKTYTYIMNKRVDVTLKFADMKFNWDYDDLS